MHRLVFLLSVSVAEVMYSAEPGPRYPPTKGEIWPAPQYQENYQRYRVLNPKDFRMEVTGNSCLILTKAVHRYMHLISQMHILTIKVNQRRRRNGEEIPVQRTNDTKISVLKINLEVPCEDLPHEHMNEAYMLEILKNGALSSLSIWGILRGLETFSQALYYSDDYTEIRVNQTIIRDFPMYQHRGLMLDTSRHFISLHNILKILNGMEYNKMNVFHWHIVDDQSFPYQSVRFPNLSIEGAYHPVARYSPNDVSRIIKHARDRGIRVIPEFDVPGHTRSWGVAYPQLLTECYDSDEPSGYGPLDVIDEEIYNFLALLFDEVSQFFPDGNFHVGGDEVDMDCWLSNPAYKIYMKHNNITSGPQLHALFMSKLMEIFPRRKLMVWQEVVDEGVTIPDDSIVQIWKDENIQKFLDLGYQVLFSTCWYLDHLDSGGDWEKFYRCGIPSLPHQYPDDWQLENRVLGGEACMWGEVVDDNNVISRIWPRASATAERLWSSVAPGCCDLTNNLPYWRMEEHACRMIRRGIAAQPPNGPGFCLH